MNEPAFVPNTLKDQYASLNKTERAILILALLMIFLSAGLSYFDVQFSPYLFGLSDRVYQNRVGEFKRVASLVKRKTLESATFSKTKTKDAVFMGDSILTDADSSTALHLEDGSVIQIQPNTLLKVIILEELTFSGFKRVTRVKLDKGKVDVLVKGERLEVQKPNGEIQREFTAEVPQAQLSPRIDFLSSADADLAVENASSEVPKPSVTEAVTTPTPLPVMTSTPVVPLRRLAVVRLNRPRANEKIQFEVVDGFEKPTLFTWSKIEDCVGYEWQLANESTFSSGLESRTTRDNFVLYRLNSNSTIEKYFWRVTCLTSNQERTTSEIRMLHR